MTKVNSITIDSSCFTNNTFINSVDCGNAKWKDNSLSSAFKNCTSLTSISNIKDNIVDLDNAFEGCSLLGGDIVIESEDVASATDAFKSTSLRKNVFIPYNSTTYTTLTSLGYNEEGTKDGVYLININAPFYTLTINPTPSDASVSLTAEGYTQVGNTINVRENTVVSYLVSKDGYTTQSGSKKITSDLSLDITLEESSAFEAVAYNSTVAAYNVGDTIYANEGMAGSCNYTAYPCESAYMNAFTLTGTITSKNVVNGETVFEFEKVSGPEEYTVTIEVDEDGSEVDYINGEVKTVNVIASENDASISTSTTLTKSTNEYNAVNYITYDLKVNPSVTDDEITLVIGGQKVAYSSLPVLVKQGTYAYCRINKAGYKEYYNVYRINDYSSQKITLTAE